MGTALVIVRSCTRAVDLVLRSVAAQRDHRSEKHSEGALRRVSKREAAPSFETPATRAPLDEAEQRHGAWPQPHAGVWAVGSYPGMSGTP